MSKLEAPNLKTNRLEIVPLSLLHREGMFALWSDERVTQYSGDVADFEGNKISMPAQRINDSDLIIDFWSKAAQEGWGLRWAVLLSDEDNSFVGIVGFNSVETEYEIAFHLLPNFWGKGIMTEASEALVNWAIKRGAQSISAFVEPENITSINLVQRLGLNPTDEISDGARKYSKMINTREVEDGSIKS